jgi:hypothetical protein
MAGAGSIFLHLRTVSQVHSPGLGRLTRVFQVIPTPERSPTSDHGGLIEEKEVSIFKIVRVPGPL